MAVEKIFLHIAPTMKNNPKLLGPAEVSNDNFAQVADPLPGVKEDQMTRLKVLSVMGLQTAI